MSQTQCWAKIVIWKNRIYVPIDKELRGDIICKHHNVVTGGHPGQYKTWELVTCHYWWPSIANDIRPYVKRCLWCQSAKIHCNKPNAPLHPHNVPTEPWEEVGVDLIGELPKSGGYNAIAVFMDHFTKQL